MFTHLDIMIFTPWPFRSKRYCRCLRPSVRPSVRKLFLVHTITRHRFGLQSPNVHQTCILGFFQLLLKMAFKSFAIWSSFRLKKLHSMLLLYTDLGRPKGTYYMCSCNLLRLHNIHANLIDIPLHFINSLWPSDDTWQHGTWSTLVQVMACCLTAPSHYLNQCWLTIWGVF